MDFFQICTREVKGGIIEVYPDFTVSRSKDLMVRARSFYAIWDEEQQVWSTDEYDVQRFVDRALQEHADKLIAEGQKCTVKFLRSFSSNGWTQFRKFMMNVSDNAHQLDENLTFADSETKKTDYVSRRLAYPLLAGDHSAWDELVSTLYSLEQREKIEWSIGAIISGDARKLHKFLVFYGPPGTGKSTVLNIVEKLFDGYVTTFEAKALVGNNNSFSTEVFKNNPLVAIQHDGDLSKVEDNSKLNSIISHEPMTMNEKFKPSYTARILAFLMMGTNKPVKITDAKAGLIRRLIDVHPTGVKIPANHYNTLMSRIEFELGAIAAHCLETYRGLGKNHYNNYRPMEMMLQTDVFFNFVEANFDTFKAQNGVSLRQAYALYKEYCAETGVEFVLPQYKVREELRNYFEQFVDRHVVDGTTLRSYYLGFTAKPFKTPAKEDKAAFSLVLDESTSLLDGLLGSYSAQYAKADGSPRKYWSDAPRVINGELKTPKPIQVVDTVLSDLDTTKEHYVKVPFNHIVIDFDLKDDDGEKSLERNLAAASEWPATYAELSKSGSGVHLHYIYTGDADDLDSVYMDGIEVKVYRGDASLRRRLSKCNNVPVSSISSGLPFKEKKVVPVGTMQSERGLRELIARNLRKEIHPGTKPSIDFILKVLQDAYDSGMSYDVTDLRGKIIAFANNSTNQALASLKVVQKMPFRGRQEDIPYAPQTFLEETPNIASEDGRLVFFDIEVYPNLLLICWKYQGSPTVVSMINPSAAEVEQLFKFKLVGFNNRRYDNHILWARFMGYNNEQLYKLSVKIIENNNNALFGEAYRLSYADIFDFSSKKQSLKKFQIDLGIHHLELDLPWDQPVEDKDIPRVIEYCTNDVISEEVVFDARKGDWMARQILADLSGLTVNDTTTKHAARIIFKDDRTPQRSFVYTDLSKEFPGYVYGATNDKGAFIAKSTYRDEEVGEGGYVYAEPGMYDNVAVLDVASMHPTSIVQLNAFGQYTPRFQALLEARLAIKNKRFDEARTMLGGILAPYLINEAEAGALSDALKIIINIVYGLTSAKFDNPFRDIRNRDNIVAKRGALFMIDLKHAVQEQGFQVVHIKTDSIKIPHATPEIIAFVREYGAKYSYDFEYDPDKDLYQKFCLVNDAVYIARKTIPVQFDGDEIGGGGPLVPGFKNKWDAVGAQFQHPFVYKMLFSGEEIAFDDLCEAKSVMQGVMYLDFQTETPMFKYEKGMHHVGRTGRFIPVKSEAGGGILYRVKDGKSYAVAGTKGYFWVEAELAKNMPMDMIDMSYFHRLVDEAKSTIGKFGNFAEFVE